MTIWQIVQVETAHFVGSDNGKELLCRYRLFSYCSIRFYSDQHKHLLFYINDRSHVTADYYSHLDFNSKSDSANTIANALGSGAVTKPPVSANNGRVESPDTGNDTTDHPALRAILGCLVE